jgi:hypothetical protein
MNLKSKTSILRCTYLIFYFLLIQTYSCSSPGKSNKNQSLRGDPDNLLISQPEHGFVSVTPASKWEESMLTGNGIIGALVAGHPISEQIILSHEKLFMPEFPPTPAPDIGSNLSTIRQMVLEGQGEQASELAVKLGQEVGIEDMIWTNPLIPASQLEIEMLDKSDIQNYARSVNFETGEATTAWQTDVGTYHRKVFTSRPDNLHVIGLASPSGNTINLKLRLAQLPGDDEARNEEYQDFAASELIEKVSTNIDEEGRLSYKTLFRKQWEGSLKGYVVECLVTAPSGKMNEKEGWLIVKDAESVLVLSRIQLSYDLPLSEKTGIEAFGSESYESLLKSHASIHEEMFNRFSLELGKRGLSYRTAEELLASSSYGNLNPDLVVQLCEAGRYTLISSTGEIPPTLQGIWGGTWRPAWSGDFTLNGNVPSAIACGLNTNFQEVTEAYIDYMFGFFDDFRDNAADLYGAPGIFVPSRSSSSGKTYHYGAPYPHLFWYAGGAWTSQFLYDYWQYTGDENFLLKKAIPFMLACSEFYEFILTKDEQDRYMFLPSYSPEVGPQGHHPLAINATMDIAALKQLLRNLLNLADKGYIKSSKAMLWKEIIKGLPDYKIDENGDLKEWIWPGLNNNNEHRHASHLYPLFYEVDPDFIERPELIQAAKTAIENRLQYRRGKNGAEMAFGLVQKGLAAAHIGDKKHAYECVDWLCNSYWSTAFTSYHDPGEIFNVDICGGLPAVVTEMIVQSSADGIALLPALPSEWPDGKISGVPTRCGILMDLTWNNGNPTEARLLASRDVKFTITIKGQEWDMQMSKGEVSTWRPE